MNQNFLWVPDLENILRSEAQNSFATHSRRGRRLAANITAVLIRVAFGVSMTSYSSAPKCNTELKRRGATQGVKFLLPTMEHVTRSSIGEGLTT
jgi:hypothetical protein